MSRSSRRARPLPCAPPRVGHRRPGPQGIYLGQVRAGVVDHPGGLTTPARRSRRRPVPGSSPGGRPRRDGSRGPGLLSTRSRRATCDGTASRRAGLLSTSRTVACSAVRQRGRGAADRVRVGPVVVDLDDRPSGPGDQAGGDPGAVAAAAVHPELAVREAVDSGRASSWRGMCRAPRRWPASTSSRWRTSSSTGGRSSWALARRRARRGRPRSRAGAGRRARGGGRARGCRCPRCRCGAGRARGRRGRRPTVRPARAGLPTAPASPPRWRTGRRTGC